jgi:hypothetical protein
MRNIILILNSIILWSCSYSVSNNFLISKSKYKIDTSQIDNYFTIIPTYKVESLKYIDSIKNRFPFSFQEKLNGRTNFDSTKKIEITFNFKGNSKLKPIGIYYWDHINFRFLFPPLLFFKKEHVHNKCINKAIEQCIKHEADGINMGIELYNFQIMKAN